MDFATIAGICFLVLFAVACGFSAGLMIGRHVGFRAGLLHQCLQLEAMIDAMKNGGGK